MKKFIAFIFIIYIIMKLTGYEFTFGNKAPVTPPAKPLTMEEVKKNKETMYKEACINISLEVGSYPKGYARNDFEKSYRHFDIIPLVTQYKGYRRYSITNTLRAVGTTDKLATPPYDIYYTIIADIDDSGLIKNKTESLNNVVWSETNPTKKVK